MKNILILLLLILAQAAGAQTITGVVVEESTGDTIPFPSVQYKREDCYIGKCLRTLLYKAS